MSDEPESVRFPQQVWDDLATSAARFGFSSSFCAWMIGAPQLSVPNDGSPVLTISMVCIALCIAIDLLVFCCTTRYRALGLAPIGATCLMLGMGLMALSGEGRFWNL